MLSLCIYTCAAAPVLDPFTGRLEGSINLTDVVTGVQRPPGRPRPIGRRQHRRSDAGPVARAPARPTGHGAVFRVENPRLEAAARSSRCRRRGRARCRAAAGRRTRRRGGRRAGLGTIDVGGAGCRRNLGTARIVAARPPRRGCRGVAVVVRLRVAEAVHDVGRGRRRRPPGMGRRTWRPHRRARTDPTIETRVAVTAERFEDIPAPLAPLIDAIVGVPPLRDRPEDVLSIAEHAANSGRGRDVELSRAAERAARLRLARQRRAAGARGQGCGGGRLHRRPSPATGGTRRLVTSIDTAADAERDEIVRTWPGRRSRFGTPPTGSA